MSSSVAVIRNRKGVPGVGRRLARELGAAEITAGRRPNTRIEDDGLIINYGVGRKPVWLDDVLSRGVRVLNDYDSVANCVDKRRTLQLLDLFDVPHMEWTVDKDVARHWLRNGEPVIARLTATGRRGRGVVLVRPGEDPPDAPLYTKFYDKTHEFRVHFFQDEVIDYVQKKKMGSKKREARGISSVDMLIRNHRRGWVFAHKDLLDYPAVREAGLRAGMAVGLDYGAADILARVDEDGSLIDCVVCEVNSAPGMSSTATFNAYIEAFRNQMR